VGVRPESCPPSVKHRTTAAALYGQSSGADQKSVRAPSLDGHPSVEGTSTLRGARYDGLVESLLHDSPVSDLSRTSGALAVEDFGAFECHCQHRAVFAYAAVSPPAVAFVPRCDGVGRPRVCQL